MTRHSQAHEIELPYRETRFASKYCIDVTLSKNLQVTHDHCRITSLLQRKLTMSDTMQLCKDL
ncbi:protein of unknown function [Ralstonia solanacearum CFBP2957]|nr:protein of unknown function [Ralstonia solanacearum CFBP2957]